MPINFKYTKNDNFFSQETPESFYWAGFIAADGCITEKLKNNKYFIRGLSLELSILDIEHLQKFINAIEYTGDIKIYDKAAGRKSASLRISSSIIINDLKKFNIVPRKSLIYTFPQLLIDHKLVNHFMRGYFDGDGSFFMKKETRGKDQLCMSICGTKEFLQEYVNILNKKCNIKLGNIILDTKIHKIRCGGNTKTGKIRDYLYFDSNKNIYLDRKYNISHINI